MHHGVLLYYKDTFDANADLTLSTQRMGILAIINGNQEEVNQLVTVEGGDASLLTTLCESMCAPELFFNIIEP